MLVLVLVLVLVLMLMLMLMLKAGSHVRRNDASISTSARKRTCESGRRRNYFVFLARPLMLASCEPRDKHKHKENKSICCQRKYTEPVSSLALTAASTASAILDSHHAMLIKIWMHCACVCCLVLMAYAYCTCEHPYAYACAHAYACVVRVNQPLCLRRTCKPAFMLILVSYV